MCIPSAAIADLPSPAFVVDQALLERNLQILGRVQRQSGAKIVLALKGFAMWHFAGLIREYLAGTTASGLWEAKLGREFFGGEVHTHGPAFAADELAELLALSDHISFNSLAQWRRFRPLIDAAEHAPRAGLRINPEHSEVTTQLYDPCAAKSRLGVRAMDLAGQDLEGISGLHFHTLCELGSDALARTLEVVEAKFGAQFGRIEWMNFGGGHHITREDYDLEQLLQLLRSHRQRYGHEVILEPGEAVALNTGVLLATVLDIVHNELPIAILDVSATAHMPDVLEMPYRPELEGGGAPGDKPLLYRLAGNTCLAGDVIGDYSFDAPLQVGSRLVFGDMAHYSMVKTTMFNGVRHPDLVQFDSRTGGWELLRRFEYEDFKARLG
ncbi:MAG: carboxynorspermidine decarboxylase [Planctomycetota bacterium]|nr:MAG: carboxynorspermidine decarboxylase [Planctomycetota bacterium]